MTAYQKNIKAKPGDWVFKGFEASPTCLLNPGHAGDAPPWFYQQPEW